MLLEAHTKQYSSTNTGVIYKYFKYQLKSYQPPPCDIRLAGGTCLRAIEALDEFQATEVKVTKSL